MRPDHEAAIIATAEAGDERPAAVTVHQALRYWCNGPEAPPDARPGTAAEPAGTDFVDLTIERPGLTGQRRELADATRWVDGPGPDRESLSPWRPETAGEPTRPEVVTALNVPPQHVAVRAQRLTAEPTAARVVVRALPAEPRRPKPDPAATPSPLWHKHPARHIRGCTTCSGHLRGLIPPERLLAGLPLVPPPAALARLATQAGRSVATTLNQPPVPGSSGGDAAGDKSPTRAQPAALRTPVRAGGRPDGQPPSTTHRPAP